LTDDRSASWDVRGSEVKNKVKGEYNKQCHSSGNTNPERCRQSQATKLKFNQISSLSQQ